MPPRSRFFANDFEYLSIRHIWQNFRKFQCLIMLKVLRGVKAFRRNSLQKNPTLITFGRVIVLKSNLVHLLNYLNILRRFDSRFNLTFV